MSSSEELNLENIKENIKELEKSIIGKVTAVVYAKCLPLDEYNYYLITKEDDISFANYTAANDTISFNAIEYGESFAGDNYYRMLFKSDEFEVKLIGYYPLNALTVYDSF